MMLKAVRRLQKDIEVARSSPKSKYTIRALFALFVLFLHSPSTAQTPYPSNELRLINQAFEKIKSEYVTPIAESTVAAACREGILHVVDNQAPKRYEQKNLPKFDTKTVQAASLLVQYFLEKSPGNLSARQLADGCLRGMFTVLDSYSSYLDPKSFKELRGRSDGLNGAVGLELGMEDGFAKIVSVIGDTPAQRAGLLVGDLIMKIDGVRGKGLSLDENIEMLRGQPGSAADLVIARKGEDRPLLFNLRREVIRPQSVSSKIVNGKFLYVRVKQLAGNTVEQLGTTLRAMRQSELIKMSGILLDLRNNAGGMLPGVVGVSAAFLPESSRIGSVMGRTPESNIQFLGHPDYYSFHGALDPLGKLPPAVKTLPMIILVNRKSASGAEMIAASLQDNRRAKVAGEQTIGYGTVQTIRQLDPETAIKITTAKLVRPNGEEFDKVGVTPDYVINMEPDSGSQSKLNDDIELAEALELFGKLF